MAKRDHGAKRLAGVSSNLRFDAGWCFTMWDNTDVWIDIENTEERVLTDLIIDLTKELQRRRQQEN